MSLVLSITMRAPLAVVAGVVSAAFAWAAQASCGSAFCTVNTNLNPLLPLTEAGTRIDLHFEYINQNQPRHGNRDVAVGQIPRHHDEVKTINRNAILTIDHNFNANWG